VVGSETFGRGLAQPLELLALRRERVRLHQRAPQARFERELMLGPEFRAAQLEHAPSQRCGGFRAAEVVERGRDTRQQVGSQQRLACKLRVDRGHCASEDRLVEGLDGERSEVRACERRLQRRELRRALVFASTGSSRRKRATSSANPFGVS
jgi:hypothetical protein